MPVVDRWYRRDPKSNKKVRTARYGVGLRWQVQWVTEDGRRQSKSFPTKDEAEANYAAIRADIYRGAYVDPEAGKITLRDFAEQWLASRDHAPLTAIRTRQRLEMHVYPHLGHVPLRKIRPTTIQAWLKTLSAKEPGNRKAKDGETPLTLGGTTRERIFSTLSAVLQAAVDDELITKNPTKAGSIQKPRRDTKPAVPWARDRIVAVEREMAERWRPIIVLGTGLGLRRGEMFGLSPDDIDFLRGVVHVRRQVLLHSGNKLTFSLPKYEKTRDVPISPHVAAVLAAHMKKYPPREVTLPWETLDGAPVTAKLLLTSREGRAANGNHIQTHVWRPACRAAGFEPTNRDGPHVLRHTYASLLLDAGESIIAVAERLGHSDPSFTLKVYGHLMPATEPRTRAAVDAFLLGGDELDDDAAVG
ncbi:site-specific integrase [Microbacterium oryzae]|uniref:tyrosine-type recombinase/integrase n=1 Tax=Microbacterium oryzae TaxID=743009 RepID=UPI0025AFDB5C|nr:site-specific integrase [Microbacterium oryzae]MDN3309598.1 site-specific integrase [Microbacterium oryzae]